MSNKYVEAVRLIKFKDPCRESRRYISVTNNADQVYLLKMFMQPHLPQKNTLVLL